MSKFTELRDEVHERGAWGSVKEFDAGMREGARGSVRELLTWGGFARFLLKGAAAFAVVIAFFFVVHYLK